MRSMHSMPTYRRGRTVYHKSGDNHPCGGLCVAAFLGLCLMGVPVWLVESELSHRASLAALDEVLNGGVASLEPWTPAGQVGLRHYSYGYRTLVHHRSLHFHLEGL
jgi:hypothetical protein